MENLKYNLNHCSIYLSQLGYGSTQNIKIKVGNKNYFCDIARNNNSAFIERYPCVSSDRSSFSKYDTDIVCATVKPDAILDREFFENAIVEISNAQRMLSRNSIYVKS